MKTLSLFFGTLVLLLALAPVAPLFTQPVLAQSPQEMQKEVMAKLKLTDAQKAKLKTIRDEANGKMAKIFTDKQKAQIEAAQKTGTKPELQLTDKQKEEIKKTYLTANEQIGKVFTPEQRKMLQEMQANTKNKK